MSDYTNTYFILFGFFPYSCFPDENILCTNKKVLDEKESKFLLLGSYPFEIQAGYEKCMQMWHLPVDTRIAMDHLLKQHFVIIFCILILSYVNLHLITDKSNFKIRLSAKDRK